MPTKKRGSEVAADAKRKGGGPRYHQGTWSKAQRERGVVENRPKESPDGDLKPMDNGTRGAVFGKGGVGIVQRRDRKAKPHRTKSARKHRARED
jgi:hypothetical protein